MISIASPWKWVKSAHRSLKESCTSAWCGLQEENNNRSELGKKKKRIQNSLCSQQALALVSCRICIWTASNQSYIPEKRDLIHSIPVKNRCSIKGTLWRFLCTQTHFLKFTFTFQHFAGYRCIVCILKALWTCWVNFLPQKRKTSAKPRLNV